MRKTTWADIATDLHETAEAIKPTHRHRHLVTDLAIVTWAYVQLSWGMGCGTAWWILTGRGVPPIELDDPLTEDDDDGI